MVQPSSLVNALVYVYKDQGIHLSIRIFFLNRILKQMVNKFLLSKVAKCEERKYSFFLSNSTANQNNLYQFHTSLEKWYIA